MKFNLTYFIIAILLLYTSSASAINQKQFVTDITEVKTIAHNGDLNKAINLWLSKKDLYAKTSGHYEYELGVLYHTSKQYKKAEKSYKNGIKITDKYPRLYYGLVVTYIALNNIDAAKIWANKSITAYPRWSLSHTALANIELYLKNYKLAIKHAQNSLSVKDNALAYYIIGGASYYLGDYMNAAININKAIQADKSYLADRDGMLIYTESLVNLNKFEAAYTALEALAKYNPNISSSDLIVNIEQIKQREKNHNK